MKCPECGMPFICKLRCETRMRRDYPPEIAEALIQAYRLLEAK